LRSTAQDKNWQYLTESQRDQIDGETKQLLRELNASIRNLADAEQLRQNTETTLNRRKYARTGLGALGTWAAGGVEPVKTEEQELDDAKSNAVKVHRENVLWYLRQKLQEVGSRQTDMMERRLVRAMEKSKSALSDVRGEALFDTGFEGAAELPSKYTGGTGGAAMDEEEEKRKKKPESTGETLSAEQMQMFEKQNQDMLKHYEETLNQVRYGMQPLVVTQLTDGLCRTAEKSLVEISELQTQLVNNLATQSAHIEQLVADSVFTTENVGGGNKQLKKAAERKSTAKYVFYASCGLSLFLVVWDLLI
jgi:syntaxin 18